MKRLLVSVMVTILLSADVALSAAEPDIPSPHLEGQLLVGFDRTMPGSSKANLHASQHSAVLKQFPEIGVDLVSLPRGKSIAAARAAYQSDRAVKFAEPNYLRFADATTPNDPEFTKQWALRNTGQTINGNDTGSTDADIDASEPTGTADAWDVTSGSTSPVIAVIDTGVDVNHSDLSANLWRNSNETAGNGIDDDGNGYVDDVAGWDFAHNDASVYDPGETCGSERNDLHGTHVAGIAGAVGNNSTGVAGVSWQVRLMPLKILAKSGGSCATGSDADAIEAILYAARMKADVINASWGAAPNNEALRQAIVAAGQAGVLFAAAAGNEGIDLSVSPRYPASFDLENEIVVAASDNNDALASFSNFGGATDLASPGVNIYSTLPDGSYGFLSGTSMSVPHLSGSLALLRAQYPQAPSTELKNRILGNVDAKSAFGSQKTSSGGRLNVNRALRQSLPVVPSVLSPNGGEQLSAGSSTSISWKTNIPSGNPASQYRVEFTTNARAATSESVDFESGMPGSFSEPADSDGSWGTAVSNPSPAGGLSLKSGAINNSQASWVTTTRRFSVPGTVSFWYRVSSENCETTAQPVCGDYFRFYLDGVPLHSRAGQSGWTNVSFEVPEGTRTLSWVYQKDPAALSGEDAAWIDAVSLSGIDAAQWSSVTTTSSGATSTSWTAPSAPTAFAKVRVCQGSSPCTANSADESDHTFSIGIPPGGWEDLRGSLRSSPDAASWAPNRLDVFAKGGDGSLIHKWWDGAAWWGWESLGGSLSADPGVVSWGRDRLDVFIRGTDNALWHRWFGGGRWSQWESLGGILASGPDVSSWDANRIDIFVKGADGGLWRRWWDGDSWEGWEPLGGVLASDPGAVSWGANRIDVFAKGTDGGLWHRWWDGVAWGGWESLGGGGTLASGPDPSSWASNRLDIFATNTSGQLLHKWWDGFAWSQFETLGMPNSSSGAGLASGPTSVSWGFNRIDIFAGDWNSALRHRWWDGASWS